MELYLNIAHVNVRSLLANFDHFQGYILNHGYDIVGVTETWLNSAIDDRAVSLESYSFLKQS